MLSKILVSKKMYKRFFCLFMVLTIIFSLMPQMVVNAAASELHVDGNRIKNASGQIVRLTGTCIPSLEWSSGGENITASFTESFDNWKSNCIRLPLNQDFWFGYNGANQTDYRNLVSSLVNMAVSRNKYVIIDLHWSDMGTWNQNVGQHNMPDDNSTAFWQSVASTYANNPSVLFDLYNEPHDVSWSVWKNGGNVTEGAVTYHTPGHQSLINTVRATGAKNIIVVGGLDWAYDLTGVDNGYALTDPSGNGIMYDVHVYPWKTNWDTYVTCAADTNPILVGECGWDDPQWYRDSINPNWHAEAHTTWCPKLLNWLDTNQFNWTGWCFHPGATPNLLTDWNYNVSAHWGAYAKPRLQSYYDGTTPTPIPDLGIGYDAENGTYGGGGQQQDATNASGGKVIGNLNDVGAYTQVNNVSGGTGGTATVKIRFSNGYSNNRSLSLYVNGVKKQQLTFAPSGSWNTFADTGDISITLNSESSNTIKLQRDSADVAAADIDKFTVTVTGGSTPTPVGGFVKGINFNGNAAVIGGNQWLSYSSALSSGLSISSSVNLATNTVTPNPPVDTAMKAMLNSEVWSNNSFTINQTINSGSYKVEFWVMEDYSNNWRSFNVTLEGQQVASGVGNLAKGAWVKYGPYNVTVSDGTLNLGLVDVTGDPQIQGMAIYTN